MGIIVKDFAEILKLVISEGRLLVTITIVGLIVLIVFAAGLLPNIDPPYVYVVWLIILSGTGTGVYLLDGGIRVAASWVRQKLSERSALLAADDRALKNLETIDYAHAQALFWIANEEGERFASGIYPIHRELVDHGFLVFDDDETRYTNKTYFRVRKVIWERITAPNYQWRSRMSLGTAAPWLDRIY